MNLDYIDIHSHLNLSPLSENQEVILAKMRELNVGTITVGTDMETSQMAIEIAEQNPELCWATVGIHPTSIHDIFSPSDKGEVGGGVETITDPTLILPLSGEEEQLWAELENLAQHPKVVAIGETGLDYFRDQSFETKEKQVEIFKKHIELAVRIGKPLMLHVRASKDTDDAYYDALEILKQYSSVLRTAPLQEEQLTNIGSMAPLVEELREAVRSTAIQANFHFFSGSKQCMLDIVAAGFTISVDGPITFSHDYDDMIYECPLESLMIETDAPFAAPVPYRGKQCEPWMVIEVARKISELKGMDVETVRVQVLKNTSAFFSVALK
jgi:TatD DNase family protein